jgi:broad specificity phosphatase PhoE
MLVYFIRHGETDLNKEHLLQGHIDTELNPEGIRQSIAAKDLIIKKSLFFDKIYCSPLKRAVQTAEIITEKNISDFDIREELVEIDYGPYDGISIKSLDAPMMNFLRNPNSIESPSGVESLQEVRERCGRFLKELSTKNFDRVLIVSHGIAIHSMFAYINHNYLNKELSWNNLQVGNCDMFCSNCIDQKYMEIKKVFAIH